MDPATIGLIGGLVNAGAGAIGAWLSGAGSDEEREARRQQLAEYSALDPSARELIASEVRESAMSRVRANEGHRATQDEAQQRLLARGRGETSMTYRAREEEARMNAARRAQGDREAILAEGRARGTVGSGEELLAQLSAGQAAAEQERMAGIQALADEEEAALQSMIAAGDMAGQREAREWGMDAEVASAEDDIARFNAGEINRMSVVNAGLRQQEFDNRLAIADRRAGIHQQEGAAARQRGAAVGQAVGGLGQALGYGIAAYGQHQAGQQGAAAPKQTQQPARREATPYEQQNPGAIGANAALPGGVQKTRRVR